MNKAGRSRKLEQRLPILACLLAPEPMTIAQIAQATGVDGQRAHAIMFNYVALGLAVAVGTVPARGSRPGGSYARQFSIGPTPDGPLLSAFAQQRRREGQKGPVKVKPDATGATEI